MSECCPCDEVKEPGLERVPPAQESLPRQVRGFPELRRDLLRGLGARDAWRRWRAREGQDFGVLLVEMWAYVADVLGFYDERVADETYVRTAKRRTSLRRIVGLLGYEPAPGAGGSAFVAAIADGRQPVTLPAGTAVRSSGFNGEKPQVFETEEAATIHPLKNTWTIEAFLPLLAEAEDTADADKTGSVPSDEKVSATSPVFEKVLFDTRGFGLARDHIVLFSRRDGDATPSVFPNVTRVKEVTSVEGKDGRT
jgi:hypothetical protein